MQCDGRVVSSPLREREAEGMKACTVAVALLGVASGGGAMAEPADRGFDLVVGAGFPAGGAGVGVHAGRIEALVEVQGLALGPLMAATATIAFDVDVVRRRRYGIYLGTLASVIGLVAAGAEDTATDGYVGAGVVAGVRLHGAEGSISHAFEVGVFDGHCVAPPCTDGTRFVSLELAYRLYFHL